MSAPLKALVALAATAACACAQGCAGFGGAPQVAHATQGSAQTKGATPAANVAQPTPTPSTPRFSARERGADAFEPFISLSGRRRFESRAVERKPARKDLKVEADYPVLLGDDRRAAREFNRRARAFVMEDVTPYLEEGPDPEKAKNEFWKDVEEFHNVSHTVVFASDEVVSVLFYVEGYQWGAAHGFHQPVTLNFDLKAGRELALAQLFKPGSDYLRTVARLCAEELERQYAQGHIDRGGYGPADGVKPKAENFKSWVITRDGLVFIFEEYQVTSYAGGEPKVLIPFDSLKEIINPRGALAGLAANQRL